MREVAEGGLQRVREQRGGEEGRRGGRSASPWGGSSADKPGNRGQGESSTSLLLFFHLQGCVCVCVFIIGASQDVLLPLQIKLSTCTTEINYRHQAGSSQTLTGLEMKS